MQKYMTDLDREVRDRCVAAFLLRIKLTTLAVQVSLRCPIWAEGRCVESLSCSRYWLHLLLPHLLELRRTDPLQLGRFRIPWYYLIWCVSLITQRMRVFGRLKALGPRTILSGWRIGWSSLSLMSSNIGQGQFCTGCVWIPSSGILVKLADLWTIAFYYLFKTIIVLWLALPQFRGAQYIYHAFLRPILARHIAPAPGVPGTYPFQNVANQ